MDVPATKPAERRLAGERIVLLGSLLSMPRKEAVRLLEQQGGEVVAKIDAAVTLAVVGDETDDWRALAGNTAGGIPVPADRRPWFEVVTETELWSRLGLVDLTQGVQSLYTPAMLAELVGAPVAAIRRWRRRGYLQATREVGRLPYFAMQEVQVARSLAGLLASGNSLARVDRLVEQLLENAPESERPLADLSIVVQEGQLLVRRGVDLTEPGGQIVIDFDEIESVTDEAPSSLELAGGAIIQDDVGEPDSIAIDSATMSAEQARSLALDLQDEGDFGGAIEACRAALLAGGDTEDHFLLADLLYRVGDLPAARERYYTALELDESYVEARASLGCILAESGDLELAAAAFRGALSQQPDFADAHYHLARTLDELGQAGEAESHWRRFLEVAPAGPWADEALQRLHKNAP